MAFVSACDPLPCRCNQLGNPPFNANGAFSISTALFLLIALPLLGRRKLVEIVAVAGITTGVLVGVFAGFFQVLLP